MMDSALHRDMKAWILRHAPSLRRSILRAAGLLVFVCSGAHLIAQERFDPDELFRQARELGFNGQREQSRVLCRRILEQNPDYAEVQIFLGRLYSWDGQYEDARKNLLEVLSRAPASTEARVALVDVELWSGNPGAALQHSETGLQSQPWEEGLLYRKAVALSRLDLQDDAAATLDVVLSRNPSHQEARSLRNSLSSKVQLYRFTANFGYERLTQLSPWQEGSLSVSRETPVGSLSARLNYARRFDAGGQQYEVDLYPALREGLYAYVNYGYSNGSVFPRHRAGLELFSNPGRGFEFSGGFRYLRFSSDVWIYTGSAGKYLGNYFVSVRPFITPGSTGTSASATFMLKRFYEDSDSYIGFSAGGGSAPQDAVSAIDLERLHSFKIGGFGSIPVRQGIYWSFGAAWDREQLSVDQRRNRFSLTTGVTKRF